MRNFARFWWMCIRSAARGISPFANDWQWAIGNPTVAAVAPAIAAGLAAWLGKEYVTAEHPILGPFAIALGAYVATWIFAFLLRTLNAAPSFYYREKNRAAAAEERLVPRILLGCRALVVETLIAEQQKRGPDSKWVQLLVKSATDAPLIDCETRLLTVERLNDVSSTESILDEPMYCEWSNSAPEQRMRMSIPGSVNQPANMFSIHDVADPVLKPETLPHIKPGFLREIQAPGRYRLNVAVSAKDAPTITRSFLLEWDGSYGQLIISQEQI